MPRRLRMSPRRALFWLMPLIMMACGGKGCVGCSTQQAPKEVPAALVLPSTAQLRVTQHGFDIIAKHISDLMKKVLGTNQDGVAVLDVAKLIGTPSLSIAGGLGLFSGKASVRDLVLTLDMAALSVQLVDGSSPARIRVAFDHARLGVQSGIVAGQANFAGISSDAACHVKNGVDVGTPDAHLATLTANLDIVLGVDAQGNLDISIAIDKAVLEDIGFGLGKDCSLKECTDKALLEDPCLECGICDAGKLASDAVSAVKTLLEPVLGDILKAVGNVLLKAIVGQAFNGKPLDVELPLDVGSLLTQAAPTIGALLGPSGPLYVRGKPSPNAFSVVGGGLEMRMDGAMFAHADACVPEAGADATPVFATLTQGAAPPIPQQMDALASSGVKTPKTVDIAVLLGRNVIEETFWSVLRSGMACAGIDSEPLYDISAGKLRLSTGALDMLLPGVRQLASAEAPLRISMQPSARPEDAPRVTLSQDPTLGARIDADIRDFGVHVEVLTRGRWLTVLEMRADVRATLAVRIVDGKLVLSVVAVQLPKLDMLNDSLFAHADLAAVAPAVAQVVVSLLLAKPLSLDLDVQSLLTQTLSLPLNIEVVGVQAGGASQDWLVLGLSLSEQTPGGP